MPIATTSLPPTTTTAPLPPPQTFDILPPLHALLARLLPPSPSSTSPTTSSDPPIPPKELATTASAITNKIQKARVAVRGLPGVEMSLHEQEDVIGELEAEVRRLEGCMEGVREVARGGGGKGEGGG
ncbi:hypothetical protein ACLMJK_000122 [Lecanora helva]